MHIIFFNAFYVNGMQIVLICELVTNKFPDHIYLQNLDRRIDKTMDG